MTSRSSDLQHNFIEYVAAILLITAPLIPFFMVMIGKGAEIVTGASTTPPSTF